MLMSRELQMLRGLTRSETTHSSISYKDKLETKLKENDLASPMVKTGDVDILVTK